MVNHSAVGAASTLSSISLTLLVFVSLFASAAGYTNCSSFATNGTAAAQYNYYRFYDFSNIPSDKWSSSKDPKDPNNVTAGASTSDMTWQYDWVKRNDLLYPGPGDMVLPIDYDQDKVYMKTITDSSDASTALGFLSSRQNDTMHQSSGIDFTEESILYLSLRLKARISGAPGACAAFFTYENDTQEADMEVLTRDNDTTVGFNTQPNYDIHGNYIPGAHWNMSYPDDQSREDWVTYRMDWVKDQVVWYIDGTHVGNTSVNVPVVPSNLYITMWGNGGTWTGNMTIGQSALLEIQWIEVAYNLSGAVPTVNASSSVCSLDVADAQGNWQPPYIFPPPHDTSAGYRTRFSALILLFALVMAL